VPVTGRSASPASSPLTPTTTQPSKVVALEPLTLAAVVVLAGLGLLNLLALGELDLAGHQLVSVVAGAGLLLLMRRMRIGTLGLLGVASYGVGLLLLLGVAAIGTTANGARRWLLIGTLTLQPSELAKLGLLLLLATILAGAHTRKRLAAALLAGGVPVALTLLEPDLSTSVILVGLALAALVLSGVSFRFLLLPVLGLTAVAPIGEHLLRPYQLARLHAFTNGSHDPMGSGWSVLQAHVAIASGGLFGLYNQPLHELMAEYLPARQTDLAFASLVEEGGLLAGMLALLAVTVLVWRLAAASRAARTKQAALVSALLAVLFGSEALLSLAGNLGVLPVAGVPFPFLSYGGTNSGAHLAALGLVLGARRDAQRRQLWRPSRTRRPRLRSLHLAALALTCALSLLAAMTCLIQTSGASLRQLGSSEMTRCVHVQAPRGAITDRHGVALALDSQSERVLAAPGLLVHRPQPVERLAALLGLPPGELESRLEADHGELTVTLGDVPEAVASRLRDANLAGVLVEHSPHRVYPFGPLLAPLLGFVGIATPSDVKRFPDLPLNSYVGRAGLEWQYDALLRGRDGKQCFYVTPAGEAVATGQNIAPTAGADLRLSLDLGLQQEANQQLVQALRGVGGQPAGSEAAAVVLDARTGDVLAMASLPSYDNNIYGPPIDLARFRGVGEQAGNPMLEHAVQEAAPPGSIFKLVVAAADSVYRVIPPDQVISTGYTFSLGDHVFHGWGYLPPQNLRQAVAWSNDVYFYKLAVALGPERIHAIGGQLGVGQPTGVDLPDEQSGLLGTPASVGRGGETWYPGSTVALGIGQGYVTVTPLQAARFTAAVASGRLLTPRLGMAFRAGPVLTPNQVPAAVELPFASDLNVVQDGMRLAVTEGTGTMLQDLPVAAGGKTGTAEDPSNPNGQPDAWFTGAAPVGQPEVAFTVMIRGGGEGHLTSEPAAKDLVSYYLQHRNDILAG
jgi:cell division protein FtsI/penicillin-binding protein 2/cell division protein FtsW (lipid II flippase)